MFTTSNPFDFDHALAHIQCIIDEEMNIDLERPSTSEEVLCAINEMHPTKALSLDGIHAIFFKKCWSSVGHDVTNFVQRAWRGKIDLFHVNKTNIVLPLKVKDPSSITQFCPIGLCNVLFKTLSVTMANRPKKYLPCLILEQQSAFIPK